MYGRRIANIKIYSVSKIEKYLSVNKIEVAVIASDQFSTYEIRKLTKKLNKYKVKVFYFNNNNQIELKEIQSLFNGVKTK